MLIILSACKFPGEAKQNNLPPEGGQSIDIGELGDSLQSKAFFHNTHGP
jgi:hypothetical protein